MLRGLIWIGENGGPELSPHLKNILAASPHFPFPTPHSPLPIPHSHSFWIPPENISALDIVTDNAYKLPLSVTTSADISEDISETMTPSNHHPSDERGVEIWSQSSLCWDSSSALSALIKADHLRFSNPYPV